MRPEFLDAVRSQSDSGHPYCLATVVRVIGSASAKTGSRAVFDRDGRNVHGWIGGGCAERFVGEQSVEALAEQQTRIVLADLDDEIFGLGIACGGQMEVFIEPVYPRERIHLVVDSDFAHQAEHLASAMGFDATIQTGGGANSLSAVVIEIARAIGAARGLELTSLRECRNLPVRFTHGKLPRISKFKILGKGRIVESLARWGALLGWETTVTAPGLQATDFPTRVTCDCLHESYGELRFDAGSAVVIASHHASDPEFVGEALRAKAAYVGMIGSRKRALETLTKNGIKEGAICPPALFVPTGLDLGCRTPDEIALSIVAEILSREST